jgi:integrase
LLTENGLAPDTRQQNFEKYGFEMSIEGKIYPYREAVLSDFDSDLKKRWYITYYVWSEKKDELVRKRAYITDASKKERYAAAKDLINAINEELRNGAIVDAKEEVVSNASLHAKSSVRAACDYFLAKRTKIVGTNTIRGYKNDIAVFLKWAEKIKLNAKVSVADMPVSKFTSDYVFQFSDFLDDRVTVKKDKDGNVISTKVGVAKKTYSNYISTLRTAWAFFIQRKAVKENPFLDVTKRRGGSSQHVPYAPEQVRLFKKICINDQDDKQLWLFVNFIYYCFLRPREEAQFLQIKHILKKTIVVPGEIAKNNQTEHIRIPKGLEAMIDQYKLRDFPPSYYVFSNSGTPGPNRVGINYFYVRNRKILELANLLDQEFDLYGWKHTGVVALYQATKDIKLIQAQCRHKDISTTDKYLRDLGLFLDEDVLDRFPEAGVDH